MAEQPVNKGIIIYIGIILYSCNRPVRPYIECKCYIELARAPEIIRDRRCLFSMPEHTFHRALFVIIYHQYIKYGRAANIAFGVKLLHEVSERQLTMCKCLFQHTELPLYKINEAIAARQAGTQRNRLNKEPYQRLQLRMMTSCVYSAQQQIPVAGIFIEERIQYRQQAGEERHFFRLAEML